MNLGLKYSSTLAIAAALAMSSTGLNAQPVADRVLSDARVSSVGSCSILTINFNVRVQMLSHFPQTGGRELHIRLKLLDALPNGRESLRTPSGIATLRSIEFEDNGSGDTSLSLFFKRDVAFDVQAGEQPQTLVIQISEQGKSGCATDAGTQAPPPPPPTAGSPEATPPRPVFKQPLPDGLYIVNLFSQHEPITSVAAPLAAKLSGHVVYSTRSEHDGQTWYQLRVGFFGTREQAEAFMKPFVATYADAWATKVSAQEREQAVLTRLAVGPASPAATQAAPTGPISEADHAAVVQLIADAEAAIAASDPDRSVQLLTKALGYPENDQSPRARELLGVTRERKGQLAQAKAEYEEYLRLYPSGENSDRIRQRLAALGSEAATAEAAPALRAARDRGAAKGKEGWRWRARGSYSQFYMRDQSSTKSVDASKPDTDPDAVSNANNINLNQLLTTADVTISGGNDRNQILMRAAGSYSNNFRSGSRDIKSLNALYFDVSDKRFNMSARIGRQTKNGYGILGRFDGAFVGWQFSPAVRFNVAAGFPVLTSRQMHVLTDRFFYGVSADIGSKNDRLQTSVYWFDQRSHGLIDRQSVGTELRYLDPKFNAYAVIDYDVKFGKLNLGLLTLNYSFPDQSTFSLTADYRQSPLLTTTNALIGQPVLSLGDLRDLFDDSTIYHLADDRTLVSKSVTASYSRPISSKLQANFDVSLTDTGGTPASGGVEAMPATGTEYFYGVQMVGSGMLWSNDIYIISMRYADTQRARTYTGDVNARIPVTGKLRISPRARYGIRDDKSGLSKFSQFQPTLRLNYYPIRHSEVELEFGGNFTRQRTNLSGSLFKMTESGYVLTAGYRLDF